MIKKLKATYRLYNFFNKKRLLHNVPLYKKYGLNKKYYSPVSSEDFKGIDAPLNTHDVKDSAEVLPGKPLFETLDEHVKQAVLPWSKHGFAVLNSFYSKEEVEKINQEVDHLITSKKVDFRYGGKKVMFAFHKSDIIKHAAVNKRLSTILEVLMDKPVELFQSINFLRASEQRTHSDSIHMSTFPVGNLIAVWVALEDVDENNGPLHYYPGSHKLPYIMNSDYGNVGSKYFLGDKNYFDYEDKIEQVIKESNLEKRIFKAKKGDVFIWHANLLHGGEPLKDKNRTRKSMVFHYYTNDAICYHEVTQRPTLK